MFSKANIVESVIPFCCDGWHGEGAGIGAKTGRMEDREPAHKYYQVDQGRWGRGQNWADMKPLERKLLDFGALQLNEEFK